MYDRIQGKHHSESSEIVRRAVSFGRPQPDLPRKLIRVIPVGALVLLEPLWAYVERRRASQPHRHPTEARFHDARRVLRSGGLKAAQSEH